MSGFILGTVATFRLEDLARAADVSPRTVRYYVQRGLLPAPAFHGKDTTYGPEHLLRLRAIKRLQQVRWPLEEIAARIAGATPAQLEHLADAADEAPAFEPPQPAHTPEIHGERWERFVLAPGLTLHLEGDAPASARRLAQSILQQFSHSRKA